MRGLAEIVRANDDATNARRYRHALAVAYDALALAEKAIRQGHANDVHAYVENARAIILETFLEDDNVVS